MLRSRRRTFKLVCARVSYELVRKFLLLASHAHCANWKRIVRAWKRCERDSKGFLTENRIVLRSQHFETKEEIKLVL